jgi:hypothetical protein
VKADLLASLTSHSSIKLELFAVPSINKRMN